MLDSNQPSVPRRNPWNKGRLIGQKRPPTGCEQITALADRGYFSGDQVLSCEGTGVMPIVPARSGRS